MKLYHIGALLKVFLGIVIGLVLYTTINVYEDPAIGIGLGLVAVLLVSRGLSFYLFRGLHQLFSEHDNEKKMSDSYKMSLLFGFFCLINGTLLTMNIWTSLLGGVLLIGFVLLHMLLFNQYRQKKYDW